MTWYQEKIREESGQTVVLFALFLSVIMMTTAVLVETGRMYSEKRNLQGDADAAVLAAIREVPTSQMTAEDLAIQYVEEKNAQDGATVQTVFVDSDEVSVTVERPSPGSFWAVLGVNSDPVVTADARAQIRTIAAGSGALPFALMEGEYALGDDHLIKTKGKSSGNWGLVRLEDSTDSCDLASGANDYRDFIKSDNYGGKDACASPAGTTISTEPGNKKGPTRQGFDDRLGGNTQGFDDVFEFDDALGRYNVLDPTSPRIGLVPVVNDAGGGTNWPNGNGDLVIVSYVVVYIGHPTQAGHPAYTGGGEEVHVTPVDTAFNGMANPSYSDYDPDSDAPIAYGLVE